MSDRATVPPAMPLEGPLVDTFGRVADDLRISVTDRCNFRCSYCMPAEGLAWLPKHEILTFEELTRVLGIFVRLGVRSLKVTGGEPLVRADLPVLVRMFREVGPDLDISLTTNGVLLDRLAAPLAEAGIDRATISCDSLLRHRFAEMTRRDALDKVLAGMKAAETAGLVPIKVNCVVIGGINDDEVVEFARWSRETGYEVRFIEYMPLDAQHAWEREKVVPAARILDAIEAVHPLVPAGHANEPATTFVFADGAPGRIGVDPLGDGAVLRHLQPAPPDRRGDVPQLPVRAGRDRPPGAPSRRRLRRRARAPHQAGVVVEVVGAPDQPSGLRPARAIDVDDRRLSAARVPRPLTRSTPRVHLGLRGSPHREVRPLSGAGSRPQAGSPPPSGPRPP